MPSLSIDILLSARENKKAPLANILRATSVQKKAEKSTVRISISSPMKQGMCPSVPAERPLVGHPPPGWLLPTPYRKVYLIQALDLIHNHAHIPDR